MNSVATTILNIDDQDAERYVKTRDLQQAGFNVVEGKTGAQALHLVEQHRTPVVLLDIKLPDISGFEVCRYIKQKWPEVMVLMTSATFTASADRALGLDAGADAYLVQPAEPLELAAVVNALLRIRRSEDALRSFNDALEARVRERTASLADANLKLTAEIEQRRRAESALVQAQKMEAIGHLTGGLAHDFNNLLTAVVGNLDLIRTRNTDPRIARLADNAFKAAERGSKLTSQLLAFSRTQKLATVAIDMNALIEGMHELLNQALGPTIAIDTLLAPALPAAMADRNQLELAILNLAINARDAMPEGGTITISTAVAREDANFISVSVRDTGTGMPPEVVARAFDPFFTTKPIGKGTGLGLSQVYGMTHQCGGSIAIDSEIGKGTTITLRFPRAGHDALVEHSADTGPAKPHNVERLLVADDDHDVREFVSGVLSDLGYQVLQAEHGEKAMALLHEFRPDLLIVDFAMPDMNGAEVVTAARKLSPSLPILFLSGFADSAALDAAVGSAPLLRKPFRPVDLAAAVRSALDAPRGTE
jgi:signal transduction histidine kinase